MAASISLSEAAAQLKADLDLLDASAKEAAALLDRAAWSLGQLDRQVGGGGASGGKVAIHCTMFE